MRRLLLSTLLVSLSGCGSDGDAGSSKQLQVTPPPEGAPWQSLAEWHLFDGAGKPAERVVPYEVVSPLWSDATEKHRFLYVPEGKVIGYQPQDIWKFPVGAVLVKTFGYLNDARDPGLGERLLETQLLVRESADWTAHTYVYDDAGTEAVRTLAGADIPVSFVDAAGKSHSLDYAVPNTNLCQECHGLGSQLDTLGGRTRQLNRSHDYGKGAVNQLDHLASLGFFDQAPPAERETLSDPAGSGGVTERTRSYFDANCAHCHAEGRIAASSGLLLDWAKTGPGNAPATYGVCKTPTSAGGGTCGLTHDVVPGKPGESILMCRIASRTQPVQMPPVATQLVDEQAVKLIGDWITSLSDPPCQ